jgi:hypothetical protein
VRNPDLDLIKLVQEGFRGGYGKLYRVGTPLEACWSGDLALFNAEARLAVNSLYFARTEIIA